VTEEEPIEGVVVDHPVPTTYYGFDFGPGPGEVFIAPVGTKLVDGKEWIHIGYTEGVEFG